MAAVNDGNVPFGSQVITIGATAFVAENINYTEPSNIIERRDDRLLGVGGGRSLHAARRQEVQHQLPPALQLSGGGRA